MFFRKKTYEEKLGDAVTRGKAIAPKLVMISVTDSCNLACKFCWRLEKEDNPNDWKKNELTLSEISKIISDCADMGVETIDLTGGGEAFIRPDIFDIIRLVKKKGMRCAVTTNSTLITEQKASDLVASGLDELRLSIESDDEKINDMIRGAGTHRQATQLAERINSIKAKSGSETPHIIVATVITAWNYNKLESLAAFAERNKAAAITFSVMLEWTSNKDMSVKGRETEIMGCLKRLDNLLDEKKINSNLKPILKHGLGKHATPSSCYAPWQMLFIKAQGDALGCCILASFYENTIGNVRNESIKKIWTGKKMNEFRARIKKKDWFKGCEQCLAQFVEEFNELEKKIK